jgi:AraC-like DNA-binding protein
MAVMLCPWYTRLGEGYPPEATIDRGEKKAGRWIATREESRMSIGKHRQMLQLAELFDCVEDALVWVKDREGRYCWVNRAFRLNYDAGGHRGRDDAGPGDILGKTDYDLSPAFLADQFRLDDEHVLAGNRIVNRIELVGQPDGLTVWNVTNKIPLVGADGADIGTAGITRRLNTAGQDIAPGSGFGPVLAYMRDHYHAPITNRQLARLAHMSVRAFERKFHGSFHLTPQKYLRKLQMRMASRALVYTGKSLADVALGCGFSDQSHFTREFRRYFGRTPREYREHYAHGGGDAAPVTNPAAGEQSSILPP